MSPLAPTPPGPEPEDLPAAELNLGRVLAVIQRILPRLDEPSRGQEVQSSLRKAATWLENARSAHEQALASLAAAAAKDQVAAGLKPEIAAVIAAAVAVLFDRPHRLVSVKPATVPTPYFNVWAFEGRTQIFQSHKVR